jgi:hypothetical protein
MLELLLFQTSLKRVPDQLFWFVLEFYNHSQSLVLLEPELVLLLEPLRQQVLQASLHWLVPELEQQLGRQEFVLAQA